MKPTDKYNNNYTVIGDRMKLVISSSIGTILGLFQILIYAEILYRAGEWIKSHWIHWVPAFIITLPAILYFVNRISKYHRQYHGKRFVFWMTYTVRGFIAFMLFLPTVYFHVSIWVLIAIGVIASILNWGIILINAKRIYKMSEASKPAHEPSIDDILKSLGPREPYQNQINTFQNHTDEEE
jgi:hypothetical protein